MKTLFLSLLVTLAGLLQAQTRVVHVFVALCDNASQGIVPVPAKLGNGDDPANNLYWGAMYGVKSYFKRDANWELVSSQKLNDTILDRCIFKHKTEDVYLVADGYKGSLIRESITDFLKTAAGLLPMEISVNGTTIKAGSGAQIMSYIGHNGLMEFEPYPIKFPDVMACKEVMILSCVGKEYFRDYLQQCGATPLVWSTGLMSPEAYTLAYALEAWVKGKSADDIRTAAATGYDAYQKCGLNGAKRLLVTGF